MPVNFFKLPLLTILFFLLINVILLTGYSCFFDISLFFSPTIGQRSFYWVVGNVLLTHFLIQLPNLLFIFIISTLLLSRQAIYQIHWRNVSFIFIISIVITLITLVSQYYLNQYVAPLLNQSSSSKPSILTSWILVIVLMIIGYVVIAMMFYLGMKLFKKYLIDPHYCLTKQQNKNLHLSLYIVLFNWYFLTLLFSFFHLQNVFYTSLFANLVRTGILFTFLIVVNTLGYFALRNGFTAVKKHLEIKKLILSSLWAFLILCCLTLALMFGLIQLMGLIANEYLSDTIEIGLCYLFLLILCVLGCFVTRVSVKLFFKQRQLINQPNFI